MTAVVLVVALGLLVLWLLEGSPPAPPEWTPDGWQQWQRDHETHRTDLTHAPPRAADDAHLDRWFAEDR